MANSFLFLDNYGNGTGEYDGDKSGDGDGKVLGSVTADGECVVLNERTDGRKPERR